MEHVGRLYDLARRREHGGVGQAVLDQLQGHEAVVDSRKGGTGEADHVDLDARPGEAIHQ